MNPHKSDAIWKVATLLMIFLAYNVLAGIISMGYALVSNLLKGQRLDIGADKIDSLMNPLDPTALSVGMIVAAVLTLAFLWQVRLVPRQYVKPVPEGRLKGWPLAIVAFILFALGVNQLCAPFDLSDGGTEPLFLQMSGSVWGIVTMVVVAPLIEEVVFRAGILQRLISGGFRPAVALVVSAALFGIAHLNLAQSIPAFLLGIVLGLLYLKTGDLRLCLPAHILNNAIAVTTLILLGPEAELFSLPLWGDILMGTGMLLAAAALLAYWWNRSKAPLPTPDAPTQSND